MLNAREYEKAALLIPTISDINAINPDTGLTALHFVAGRCERGLLEVLWQHPDLDELARDAQGRYASELAWVIADDEMLGTKLMEREKIYAQRTNQIAWPKPDQN